MMNTNIVFKVKNEVENNLRNLFSEYQLDIYYRDIKNNPYFAKSDKTHLSQHSIHVVEHVVDFLIERNETDIRVIKISIIAAFLHDIGKGYMLWQTAIKDSKNMANKLNGYRHELGFLPFIYELLTASFNGKNVFNISNTDIYLIIITIASHHDKLIYKQNINKNSKLEFEISLINSITEDSLQDQRKKLKNVNKKANEYVDIIVNIILKTDYTEDDLFTIIKAKAALMRSDRKASALESDPSSMFFSKIEDNIIIKKDVKLKDFQIEFSEQYDKDLIFLNADTGAGKTLAVLGLVANMYYYKIISKVVLCLPTRFTTDSLYNSLSSYTNSMFNRFHGKNKGDSYIEKKNNTTFTNTFNICTADILFYQMLLFKEENNISIYNTKDSLIIFDELDSYDTKAIDNVCILIEKFAKKLNWKIVFMSATIPKALEKYLSKRLFKHLPKIKTVDAIGITPNKKYTFKNLFIKGIEEAFNNKDLLNDIKKHGHLLIYVNTIRDGDYMYEYVKSKFKNMDVILYSSGFNKVDSIMKEEQIEKALGKNGTKDKIVIMTQIGQMSLNISADVCLQAVAFWQDIIQRLGRTIRFTSSGLANIYFYIPHKNGKPFYAPYTNNFAIHPLIYKSITHIKK